MYMKTDKELLQDFTTTRNLKPTTIESYTIFIKNYTTQQGASMVELIKEAENEEEQGIRDTDKITTGLFWEKYPEFKELYFNNEYNSLKIRKELEISRYAYDQLQRKVTKETGYIKRNQWGMDKK